MSASEPLRRAGVAWALGLGTVVLAAAENRWAPWAPFSVRRQDRFDFEQLDAFVVATDMVVCIDAIAQALPAGRGYMRDQLRRAANSVPLNSAEGAGEFAPAEKARFYRIARRSATEVAAQVLIAAPEAPTSGTGTGTGTGTEAEVRERALRALFFSTLLGEELFYRGYLHTVWRERRGPWVAGLLSAAVFGIRHATQLVLVEPYPVGAAALWVAMAFVIGLAMSALYERTRSIWPPVVAHYAFNAVPLLLGG